MAERDGATEPTAGPAPDEVSGAGDPACWLARVCDACGAVEDGPPSARCPRCGAPRAPA